MLGMDGKSHSKAFSYLIIVLVPVFIALGILITTEFLWYIPLLIISNSMVDPDEDQKWNNGSAHRSWITHSVVWSLLITATIVCSAYTYMDLPNLIDWGLNLLSIFTIPLILHLILDIYSRTGNRTGKYNIKIGRRLKGWQTVLWFLSNIAIMITYDVILWGLKK